MHVSAHKSPLTVLALNVSSREASARDTVAARRKAPLEAEGALGVYYNALPPGAATAELCPKPYFREGFEIETMFHPVPRCR